MLEHAPAVLAQRHRHPRQAQERGFGDEDISSIYRLKSALFPAKPT